MKREDFVQIIKLRSFWKIDRRMGNYKLPNGKHLSSYVLELVESQMKLDSLGIKNDGNLCFCEGGEWNPKLKAFNDYMLSVPFHENETCSFDEMEKRIRLLVHEIIE